MYYEYILEKIAAQKNFNKFPMDAREKEDRDLIEKYQKAPSRFEKGEYLKKLKTNFGATIRASIDDSGVKETLDDFDALAIAEAKFADIIGRCKLTRAEKPISFIRTSLTLELKKEKYNTRELTSSRSQDLSMKNGYIKPANQILRKQLGRVPTVDETYNYITDVMKKQIDKDEIVRNSKLDRTILSGNQKIGDSDNGAEFMTLMDMKNNDEYTPEDVYNFNIKQQKLDTFLNTNFTRPERKTIKSYYGIGEFQGKPQNAYKAAITGGMPSYYAAKKVIDRFETLVDEHDVFDRRNNDEDR